MTASDRLKWHNNSLPLRPWTTAQKEQRANTLRAFPQRVFETLSARFGSRADDVARFAATRYSFEEWLNWEGYAACATVSGWEVHAKPRYCDLGADGCRDFGDLLIVEGSSKLLVEIGLVHDGTGNKWRDKLEWDVEKLARLLAAVSSLHVVVLVSSSGIKTSDAWQRWLGKVKCMSRPNAFERITVLPPDGQMVVTGWVGECNGARP